MACFCLGYQFNANCIIMKKNLLIAALAVFGLASCSQESFVENESAPQHEIALTGVSHKTRSAINGTDFPTGYDMLVSAYYNADGTYKDADAAANFFTGIQFTKDETTSVWKDKSSTKYWPLTGKLDFLCIASAGLHTADNGIVPTCVWGENSNCAKKVIVTVPDNSTKFDDILYGSANAQKYASTGTPITFNHAQAALVFTAKSSVAYNETDNVGITIEKITVNGAKYSGTLTVSNPAAGNSTGTLSATWDVSSATAKSTVEARVWESENLGTNASESAYEMVNLSTTATTVGADHPFGDAYVLLPAQTMTSFTIHYTLHNGFAADGTTKVDNAGLDYKYDCNPNSGTETWDAGKKYVYAIDITMREVNIKPEVTDWDKQDVTLDPAVDPTNEQ